MESKNSRNVGKDKQTRSGVQSLRLPTGFAMPRSEPTKQSWLPCPKCEVGELVRTNDAGTHASILQCDTCSYYED